MGAQNASIPGHSEYDIREASGVWPPARGQPCLCVRGVTQPSPSRTDCWLSGPAFLQGSFSEEIWPF